VQLSASKGAASESDALFGGMKEHARQTVSAADVKSQPDRYPPGGQGAMLHGLRVEGLALRI